MSKKKLSDDLTTLIAKQLHAFDYPCGSAETYDDFLNRLSDEAIFKRYRNDTLFRNKVCSMVASIFPLLDEHSANLDKDIAELRLQCISDFGQYVDGTESMVKRLSEADKVINMAKSALESGSDYWTNEALAAIEDYEEDQPDSTHNHTSKEVREQVERWEPRIGTPERKEWQEDENRKARARLDAIPIRESEKSCPTPFTTTALPELIEKVEKMTIERCVTEIEETADMVSIIGYSYRECLQVAIRALPTGQIKLEELP